MYSPLYAETPRPGHHHLTAGVHRSGKVAMRYQVPSGCGYCTQLAPAFPQMLVGNCAMALHEAHKASRLPNDVCMSSSGVKGSRRPPFLAFARVSSD